MSAASEALAFESADDYASDCAAAATSSASAANAETIAAFFLNRFDESLAAAPLPLLLPLLLLSAEGADARRQERGGRQIVKLRKK